MLAQTCALTDANWPLISLGILQLIVLGYLMYAFNRIARNQVELAEFLRKKLAKDDN